jgi:hypothetical protein
MSDVEERASLAIDGWLSRLVDLIPDDGRLTDEILRTAGRLPVIAAEVHTEGRSPREIVDDRELGAIGALAYSQAYAGRNVERRALYARAACHEAKVTGDATAMANAQASADFWAQIGRYIAAL